MPPGYKAQVGDLKTFELPPFVTGSTQDIALGKAMIDAWQKDGILQIRMDPQNKYLAERAFKESQRFFSLSSSEKKDCVDNQSFAGYIASGEEITDGIADYSEIFTVTKDLPLSDPRVQAKWPCHGPCPWPNDKMQQTMQGYMDYLGTSGERMLQLIALGLELPALNSLTNLTRDGWHHLRILRFPKTGDENGKGVKGRGIGSHTDYGLLVIAAQDDVGGLFIRPPYEDEKFQNWKKSTAGMAENDDRWVYVPPEDGVFTVFPGDMMQFITNNRLPSTPHKVGMNIRERFAFAYFHEPNFNAVLKPLEGSSDERVHYGTHFTNMFMRNYPERITATRMHTERRLDSLESMKLMAEQTWA
ncbi:Clavaminate synthase-like protein [Corynespora cassiicola Philippines]|uniref:Clavaminate synthase-like protein n=1 Tax=Corynespora cassiicola Philippines TaxID=1448308 RepID=A0A2T2NQR7_CORCC|nr:Clavaminate synthase-like protein [Corynespora cassiicola Philippines]